MSSAYPPATVSDAGTTATGFTHAKDSRDVVKIAAAKRLDIRRSIFTPSYLRECYIDGQVYQPCNECGNFKVERRILATVRFVALQI
jgi:hypothetical protein